MHTEMLKQLLDVVLMGPHWFISNKYSAWCAAVFYACVRSRGSFLEASAAGQCLRWGKQRNAYPEREPGGLDQPLHTNGFRKPSHCCDPAWQQGGFGSGDHDPTLASSP